VQHKVQLDVMIAFSEYGPDIQKKRGDLCKLVIIFRGAWVGGGGVACHDENKVRLA